ncbi:pyroglutamyl-peptidase 1 [Tribolium castaneum]|nr:PREDICTED: pyroglutamyl-peptidase 1 [Tribolium castaneum]XP_008195874.1 PREDICTED: pyroglutamyl-peptidase 1 [Tribolium castaneum]|eukprot:XP_008195873.1 PREDICTED: pyroglutamyl-peptidase 1 [Tribolium castaneum]
MTSGNIIVTGFGPFGDHAVNASWESVKLLPQEVDGYTIIKEEISVAYETVDKKIHLMWKEYNPALVIHVGVSALADKITLETCAHKEGYTRLDVFGQKPVKGTECSAQCAEKYLKAGINVNDICEHLNCNVSTKACVSENAGRYLCEYVFYTSLSIDKDKAMFIHVPPLGQPYSAEELASGILEVIRCALKQATKSIKQS